MYKHVFIYLSDKCHAEPAAAAKHLGWSTRLGPRAFTMLRVTLINLLIGPTNNSVTIDRLDQVNDGSNYVGGTSVLSISPWNRECFKCVLVIPADAGI